MNTGKRSPIERRRIGRSGERTSWRATWTRGAPVIVATLSIAGGASAQSTTSLVSRTASGAQDSDGSQTASITSDGKYVVFQSNGSHLVLGDTNGAMDVFVRDLAIEQNTRVSVASNGAQADGISWNARITPDGRFVSFDSFAANLVAGDNNGVQDVFLRDRVAGTTAIISVSTGGAQGNHESGHSALSADGMRVVFGGASSNLVSGDTNGVSDVFLRDRASGATTRISVSSLGAQGDSDSNYPSISADGRFVAFWSAASNLVAGDTNGFNDAFVRDLQNATTERVSLWTNGAEANESSGIPVISADGRFVAFDCAATNWIAGVGGYEIWLRDRQNGTTELVSQSSSGVAGDIGCNQKSLSSDGRFVVFQSWADNLVVGDTNSTGDIFLRDRLTQTTERMSISTVGVQTDNQSWSPTVTDDGHYVAFDSDSTNLVPHDTNGGYADVFVRDRWGCTPQISNYCAAGSTSHGCVPTISSSGSPSASAGSGFTISVASVEGQRNGLVFYGASGPLAVPWSGGSSFLCVGGHAQRTPVQNSGGTSGACDGHFALDWNLYIATHPTAVGAPFVPGDVFWAQAWFRDPTAPGGSNLSDGLWFELCL